MTVPGMPDPQARFSVDERVIEFDYGAPLYRLWGVRDTHAERDPQQQTVGLFAYATSLQDALMVAAALNYVLPK